MSLDALNDSYINDKRQQKEFKSLSFSGYKKSAVITALTKSINEGKIEEALNWTAELICAGFFKDIWESILLILGKNVHLANPKLIIYTFKKYESFRSIINNSDIVNSELELRNNNSFRQLFTELVSIYCVSEKRPAIQKINVKKEDFNLTEISNKFEAPSIEFCEQIFKKTDPKEIFVPLNEFSYHLKSKNMLKCIYWLEWLLAFDQERRKQKNPLKCVNRTFVNVSDVFETDIIWLLWESMIRESSNDLFLKKLIDCLLELFCIRYAFNTKIKRRYLLYYAIQILTDTVNTKALLVNPNKKKIVSNIVEKTNLIYKVVKKNEIQPKSSYLLNSISEFKSEKEKTVDKFNMIFELGGIE